jgi:hypothetical protein
MTPRKKPGVAFWATVGLVVVLLVYPLSVGPACWLLTHCPCPAWSAEAYRRMYLPLSWACDNGPSALSKPFGWYCSLWIDPPAPPLPSNFFDN